jgi:hypothetical protein
MFVLFCACDVSVKKKEKKEKRKSTKKIQKS